MGFFNKEKKDDTDAGNSADESKAVHDSHEVVASGTTTEADVQCPPYTTEGKLMWKVDLHVVPFLCIMYLLAFLGELLQPQAHPSPRPT